MLVYEEITARDTIKSTNLNEASHYYEYSSSTPTVTQTSIHNGLGYIIENVEEDKTNSKPAVFNVYKIISHTGDGKTAGNLIFLKKVGYKNGEKVVEYEENWSEENAQKISVTTTKTVAITDIE
jgi:hypothetical protein